MLITTINDNPKKWTNHDFWEHYTARSGRAVTLQEIGYLGYVIDRFANAMIATDGTETGYGAVERQIIEAAKKVGSGKVPYSFKRPYTFGHYWQIIPDELNDTGYYSFGESTVKGNFDGSARKEGEFLVINGVMNYEFSDEFKDPYQKIERTKILYGVTREEAERIVGDAADEDGEPYDIKGSWRTKFNATVRAE